MKDNPQAGNQAAADELIYARAAPLYVERGWTGVLPLPIGKKWPPPKGYTGENGRVPTADQIELWLTAKPGGNVALRMPDSVVGIDVDAYGGKTGNRALGEAESRWGELPPTVRSTAREDGTSGIRLFRIPAGTKLPGMIKFTLDDGSMIGDIEIIQRHHRYVVAEPSRHPQGGNYRWLQHDGERAEIPAVDALPELPLGWLKGLAELSGTETPRTDRDQRAKNNDDAARDETDAEEVSAQEAAVLDALTEGPMSPTVVAWLARAIDACGGTSRYDHMVKLTLAALRLGRQGEPGVRAALLAMRSVYVDAVADAREGGHAAAVKEFGRAVSGAGAVLLSGDLTAVCFGSQAEGVEEPDEDDAVEQVRALFVAEPLPLAVENLPPFPITALPPVLANMATAVAAEHDVDPAMPVVFALGAVSAALQGRLVIQPYAEGSWRENGSLYVLGVTDTGERKSPVMATMFTRPISAVEDELHALSQLGEPVPVEVDDNGHPVELIIDGESWGVVMTPGGEETPDGPLPRLLASDVTPEKLADLMDAQGGVMCLADAEGSAFDMMLGLYNPNAPVNLYLCSYTREAVNIDRKNGGSIRLREPSLTFCLATQHDVWNRVMATPRLVKKGVTARFAVAYTETRRSRFARRKATAINDREPLGQPVPPTVASAYFGLLYGLGLHMRERPNSTILLTAEAELRVRSYAGIHGELDVRMLDGDGDLGGEIAGWAAKSGGRMLRTALMLHMAEHGPDGYRYQVSAETIDRAIIIEEWFIANARAAHGMVSGDGASGEAASAEEVKAIAGWLIRQHKAEPTRWAHTPMPLRHVNRNLTPKKLRQAPLIWSAIQKLTALNYVVQTKVGKQAAVYLHPDLY
ncbi:hypothetical protein A5750_22845 [Mycobacterium sp. 852002-51613_SCH5001154]|uniref:DUF3987 domain-containing protein n=1 Tax=Mycobacterium sp. 852002-51613_SCH5001154 TaxID=1834104 RepID=UPI0007FFEDF5|nr:DUF3987 domain-containing protein [Mycobacterium sp. 852002-51613_SCH5001154]OBF70424.1 hypothetical protein A5750_22845 [Mycobacterium sp. 852002-51613_SCH5001154]